MALESAGPADPADPAEPAFAASPVRIAEGIGKSYTMAKFGPFYPEGDIEALDNGIAAELVFGRSLLSFLAVEGTLGYLTTDGRFGSVEVDLWAIPLFVNARASIPIVFFEPYGGVGIGGLYADYEIGTLSESDFVPAWNAFLGLEVGIGQLAVGAEVKYLQTDDTKDNFSVEGISAFLFVMLPF
jgi:opacity protein-like surface antigen